MYKFLGKCYMRAGPARTGQGELPPLPRARARRPRRRVHQEHREMNRPRSRVRPGVIAGGGHRRPAAGSTRTAFHERIFSCNPNAANPACGTDHDDRPMACVPAYQLGGGTSAPPAATSTERAWKTGPRGDLPAGGPARTAGAGAPGWPAAIPRARPSSCDHDELSCLRTDLLEDEGVCMTVNTCQERPRLPRSGPLQVHGRRCCARPTARPSSRPITPTACRPTAAPPDRLLARRDLHARRDARQARTRPTSACPTATPTATARPTTSATPASTARLPPICIPGLLGLRCKLGPRLPVRRVRGERRPLQGLLGPLQQRRRLRQVRQRPRHLVLQRGRAGARACAPSGAPSATSTRDCLYPGEICARITNLMPQGQCLQACALPARAPPSAACPTPAGRRSTPPARWPQALPWVCWPGFLAQLCRRPRSASPASTAGR